GSSRAAKAADANDEASLIALEKGISTAPVSVDGHVLFHVRGVVAYPAYQRAHAIGQRIEAAAENHSVTQGSLRLVEGPSSTDILANDTPIMSVFDADAHVEGASLNRGIVGQLYLRRIGGAIKEYRDERTSEYLINSAYWAVGATAAFAFLVLLLYR